MNSYAGIPSKRKNTKSRGEKSNLPLSMRRGAYIFCFVMCIPAIYGIFKYFYTNTYSLLLGFCLDEPFTSEWTLVHFSDFFNELFSNDSSIQIALRNTFMYFGIGILKSFLSFVLAYFLYKKIPLFRAHRFLLFLPCIIPSVVAVNIYKQAICKEGPIYTLLNSMFGVTYPQPWGATSNPDNALLSIFLYSTIFSGVGSTYLIYVGNMNRIPNEMLESARLDGCNSWTEFWKFVFPLTWGTFSTFLILSIAGIFCSSGPVLYFFNNSENIFNLNMQTLGYVLFDKVRGNGFLTYYNSAAAIGIVFTLFTIPIVVITKIIANKLDKGVTF